MMTIVARFLLVGWSLLVAVPVGWCESPPVASAPEDSLPVLTVTRFAFDEACDADLDDQPDDWTKRTGPLFPHYVRSYYDRVVGCQAPGSLRIDANGGQAAVYSPLIPVDDVHAYSFVAQVRASGLRTGATLISLSFLDDRRQRLHRELTTPVSESNGGWCQLTLGAFDPPAGTHFLVIGCHLLNGQQVDIGGAVWFDDLTVTHHPRVVLESGTLSYLVESAYPVQIQAKVAGLASGHAYTLDLEFLDIAGNVLAEKQIALSVEETPDLTAVPTGLGVREWMSLPWDLARQQPGYYRVTATLRSQSTVLATGETAVAVLSLVEQSRPRGEFGWSLSELPTQANFAELALQSGLHYVKLPVWTTAPRFGQESELGLLMAGLHQNNIQTIGVLDTPPAELRKKFTSDWRGISEVFVLPPDFWGASLRPVLARYGAHIRHWQIGADGDRSFSGMADLPLVMRRIDDEFRRAGIVSELGIAWPNQEKGWPAADAGLKFLSMPDVTAESARQMMKSYQRASAELPQTWAVINNHHIAGQTLEDRVSDLASRVLQARVAGADAIFYRGVFSSQNGLITKSGEPQPLFLPWRTLSLSLQGATYLGEYVMPGRSRNAVFTRDQQTIVAVWNPVAGEDRCFLGDAPRQCDLYGRSDPVAFDAGTGEHVFAVGPVPRLLLAGDARLARWQLALQFGKGKMQSEFGVHEDSLKGHNHFSQGISGEIDCLFPPDWQAEPKTLAFKVGAGSGFEQPFLLSVPAQVTLGHHLVALKVRLSADRSYEFRVYRDYQVGLGDIEMVVVDRKLPDGRLEIEQTVVNKTNPPEVLDYRCTLFIPGARRQRLTITQLGAGQDRKFYFLDQAEKYRGQELWIRLEQDGGRRVMNHRWKVGENWDQPSVGSEPSASAPPVAPPSDVSED